MKVVMTLDLYNTIRLDVSGMIEKINVYVTLAIIPRLKNINKAF